MAFRQYRQLSWHRAPTLFATLRVPTFIRRCYQPLPDIVGALKGKTSTRRFRWPTSGRITVLRPLWMIVPLAVLIQRCGIDHRLVTAQDNINDALRLATGDLGLHADPKQIYWVDPTPTTLGTRLTERRAVFVAKRDTEPADVYLAKTRLSPEGRLLEVTDLINLSDTSAVDEEGLVVSGPRAAWTIAGAGLVHSIQYADLRGEILPGQSAWSRLKRLQNAITNRQTHGQFSGIGRRSFKLDPPGKTTVLAFSYDALLIDANGQKIRVPTEGAGHLQGGRFILEQPRQKARPGNLVTWSVDRVRALPWFGSDKMQAIKAVAFAGLDWTKRVLGNVTGDDGSSQVQEELGELLLTNPIKYTDPKTGWPPAAMKPMLKPALEGEGKWRLLDRDPFVRKNSGAPSPFATSFIRTDRKRAYSQIYVTVWDPRQVQLHTMSGTVEPKSATGETGPGMVPRKPEVLGRLLAGFNGGFQATHGEFGMAAEGVVYLPPKGYSATVAKLDNGDNGFGTWPDSETVPAKLISFRQNMTPLVMDGKINPYRRNWWGGVPPGWTDEARTVRSGLCLTNDNFIAYFYGSSCDADHLALAMQRAHCQYGIHLDMNPGHTGLEFYRAGPKGTLPTIDRKLDKQWETRGPVPQMDGWEFIGRRMLRYMGLMNFPRYIDREARDFFYLTLRPLLPGKPLSDLTDSNKGEGKWQVSGLPQHGFPPAIATTSSAQTSAAPIPRFAF